jgi:negative regulator of sigma E activity
MAAYYTRQGGRMQILSRIKTLAGLDFADRAQAEVEAEEDAAAEKVAPRFARGSVGIQRKAFQTKKDLNRLLARVGLPSRPEDRS